MQILEIRDVFNSVTAVDGDDRSKSPKKLRSFEYERKSCKNGQASRHAVDTTDRLRRLRLRMKASSYDAYIVPTDDEHQSEYISNHDKRREFITGFSGSAGLAVILQNSAALWTDGRYFLQAESQLDCNWFLMKDRQKNVPTVSDWLSRSLAPGAQIGVDPKLISYKKFLDWYTKLKTVAMDLVGSPSNLIDDIWSIPLGRAPESLSYIFIHDIIYSGKSYRDKIDELRKKMLENEVDGIVITSLDETAWLFNLRSNDVPYTPVFKAYAFVSLDHIRLYVNPLKLTDEVRKYLNLKNCNSSTDCIVVKDYKDAFYDMKELSTTIPGKILVSSLSSYGVVSLIPEEQRKIQDGPSLVSILRSVKNPTEIKGMKKANLKDAVAITDFVARLDKEVNGGIHWDEIKAAKILSKFRSQQPLYIEDSFATISSSGSNGAIVHYIPTLSTNRNITTREMYLLDSGAQYLDGTTDITRTFHFGEPTDFQKEAYTRVLMGAINLMTVIFPDGTKDVDLDILARVSLFDVGLNYLHGTGHGIGTFLGVHEDPIRIGTPGGIKVGYPLKPGMFMSDEPGYYQDGEFGIRLENVMMVTEAYTPHKFNDVNYYTFEPVTFLPFEPKLIKFELLSNKQKNWLNDYNAKIRNTVGVALRRQKRESGLKWLLSKTEYIPLDACINSGTQRSLPPAYFVVSLLMSLYMSLLIC